MSEKSNIAIVVPVLDDTPELHALIDRIHSWSEQPKEIVIVSANRDLELSAFCEAHGCRYLESEPCRGMQLDCGARGSEASVLWFLHADAAPYPSSLGDIALALYIYRVVKTYKNEPYLRLYIFGFGNCF